MSEARRLSTDEVYAELKAMLLDFTIPPGSRLTETELASMFGISRTPVREVLQRLETEGLISIRPKQGCFVRELDIEEIAQYYRVRVALEQMALDEACIGMPDAGVHELLEYWNPETAPTEISAETMQARDEQFHMAIAQGSGNRVLVRYLAEINNHIRIIRRLDFTLPERVLRTYQEHHAMLSALLERDAVAARRLMQTHIQKSEEIAKNLTLIQLARHRKQAPKVTP
jgi:DNA-binding GntR family transcriptional regulator